MTEPPADNPNPSSISNFDVSPHADTNTGNLTGVRIDKAEGTFNFNFPPPAINVAAPSRRIPLELPERPRCFQSRADELARLLDGLRPGYAYTLCGPGGIGKTALAAQALHTLHAQGQLLARFPGGLVFYSFYKQPQTDLAFSHIVLAFGEELRPSPADAAARVLSGGDVLVALDGAELAEDLHAVLRACGRCGVLITSQDRAHKIDARETLTPFDEADGLALLRVWAGEFAAEDTPARRIYAFTGGLPLALSIAGKYMDANQTSARKYADLLESSPLAKTLEIETRRSESVPVLLGYSVARLDEPSRAALALIGRLAFAPVERADLAAALGLDDSAAHHALAPLMRFGLLESAGDGESCIPVHRLLHQYARHQLELPDDALRSLSAYYMDFIAAQYTRGPQGFAALDQRLPHLLALLEALEAAGQDWIILALTEALDDYTDRHGRWAERRRACEVAISAAERMDDERLKLTWEGTLGVASAALGEPHRAIVQYEKTLALAREAGNRRSEGAALANMGLAYANLGEPRRAIEYYEQALPIARATGDRRNEGAILGSLGLAYAGLGEPRRAIELFEQALELARDTGDRRNEGAFLGSVGNAYANLGETRRAIEYYQQALEIARATGDRRNEGTHLGNLGLAYAGQGEPRRAIEYYEQGLEIARATRDLMGTAIASYNLAGEYHKLAEPARALPLAQEAARLFKQIGHEGYVRRADLLAAGIEGRAAPVPSVDELLAAFAPFIDAAAALDDPEARAAVEELFPEVAANGWRIAEPIRMIWQGQRDPAALTAGLGKNEAIIIRAILEKLAAPQ